MTEAERIENSLALKCLKALGIDPLRNVTEKMAFHAVFEVQIAIAPILATSERDCAALIKRIALLDEDRQQAEIRKDIPRNSRDRVASILASTSADQKRKEDAREKAKAYNLPLMEQVKVLEQLGVSEARSLSTATVYAAVRVAYEKAAHSLIGSTGESLERVLERTYNPYRRSGPER